VRTHVRTVIATDTNGNVYTSLSTAYGEPHDSLLLVRASIRHPGADTLDIRRAAPVAGARRQDEQGNRLPLAVPAFAVGEEVAVAPDGWIAVARLDPLRVDWIRPDGRVVRGAPTGDAPVPLGDAEKERYLGAHTAAIRTFEAYPPSGIRDVLLTRYRVFPNELPPFEPGALVAGGDDLAYLQRLEPVGAQGARHDVFDRTGRRVGVLRLPADQRVVAVTERYRYVVRTDADGVQTVLRFAMKR
jgi:hypothetical protein